MCETFSKPLVVGAAILDSADQPTRMLAARRKAPKSLAGYWEFPGGKVEQAETHVLALIREIHEELGVGIDVLDHIVPPTEAGWPLDNGMMMQVYTATIQGRMEPKPLTEHDRLQWVDLTAVQLHALQWIPADRPILDAILKQLGDQKTTV